MQQDTSTFSTDKLPITTVLPEVIAALASDKCAIISAPPGAGKTTVIPLVLMQEDWCEGKIILLEPRRLAARAAAARMASSLGETVGGTVGYRIRLDARVSDRTRIEVVTEGVFTRMVLEDPLLSGVSAVIFDEFHERSLDADFGLALALDVQSALREDLRIVVMSATLDIDRLSALLEHPIAIVSKGRGFPVEICHRDRPSGERIEASVANAIIDAHRTSNGSILAFLPGQGEILRAVERLEGRFGPDTILAPLFGNLSQKEQDIAIRPAPAGQRKIVLATSIAETSITIDGVRIVIDSGLQRIPVFNPATGITRLETVRVSRASAEQRAGRAGRTEPGIAVRLWHAGQTAALPAFTPPQILSSDLSQLALDLAHWGVRDTGNLHFLDQPPPAALAEARALLVQLEALDPNHSLTTKGRLMRNIPLPPRLSAMVICEADKGRAGSACELAVLLSEQGLGGSDIDLDERLRRFRTDKSSRALSARSLAHRIMRNLPKSSRNETAVSVGQMLLHAYPDRVALQRGRRGRYVMANGSGAELPETERLAATSLLVIADLSGSATQGRILAAAGVTKTDVLAELGGLTTRGEECFFDRQNLQVRARRVTRLAAIILEESPLPKPTGDHAARALADGVREVGLEGLPFSKDALHLLQRLAFLHLTIGEPWPDVSENALLARLDEWFVPFHAGKTSLTGIDPASLGDGLYSLVPYGLRRELDRLAPTHYEAPTRHRHPIRYGSEGPVLTIRVQELFGLKSHPSIAGGRLPLVLELTSPAHRPIQTTRDLPGFWSGSWKDVRAEMRGRYPKHPWPDNPADAKPTNRAKPRST